MANNPGSESCLDLEYGFFFLDRIFTTLNRESALSLCFESVQ